MRSIRRSIAGLVLLVAACCCPAVAADPDTAAFTKFLAERDIDREQRRVLEEPGGWDDDRQRALIRVLKRLDAPAALEVPWRLRAETVVGRPEVGDRLVRIEGRAVCVTPLPLSPEQAVLAARPQFDVVRLVAADGLVADVVVPEAPKEWPRRATLSEPAFAVGLPLATGATPRPIAAPNGAAASDLLLAATSVGWSPSTPLGTLGMDYGLFSTVIDGRRLEAGDAAAFYAILTAVGRALDGSIEGVATKVDVLRLIDPSQKWFASQRGEAVTVSGIARRAIRIAIDEPWRREQVGADHYWELYVFVRTPLLSVGGRTQDDYPIVCCVRTLPEGFPTGDDIGEKVSVSGFAMKRYGYPLPDLKISSSQGDQQTRGERMETALLIGKTVIWRPEPSVAGATSALSWVFSAIAALVGLVLVYSLWSMSRRDGRRADLPDRIELPGDRP